MKFILIILFPLLANAFYIDKDEFKKGIFKFYQKGTECKSRCIKTPKNFNPYHYKIVRNKLVLDDKKKLKLERAAKRKADFEAAVAKELAKIGFGTELYAKIKVSNINSQLTAGQRLQMRRTFSEIKEDLLNGDLEIARTKIYKIAPDGVIVTTKIKDYVLNEINTFLSNL